MKKDASSLSLRFSLNLGRPIHKLEDLVSHHVYATEKCPGYIKSILNTSPLKSQYENGERVTIDALGYQVQVKPLLSNSWITIPEMQIPWHRTDAIWIATGDTLRHPQRFFGEWRIIKVNSERVDSKIR